jgi:hypothetical protein
MNFGNGTYTHSTLEDGYDYFTTDKWGKEYHFRILTFPVPSGLESEAVQVIEKEKGIAPYIFQVLDKYDEDAGALELLLKDKIQKGINKRYLEHSNGQCVLTPEEKLFGRIDYNNDFSDTMFESVFIVDGKRVTIEQLVLMLGGVEGFNFIFSVHDPLDEFPE